MMTTDAKFIAEAVLEIERQLDLDDADWTVGDMHLWPLYRIEIYRLLFALRVAETSGAIRPRLGPALRICRRVGSRSNRPGWVWLVADGVSYTRIGDRHIERFCTPLASACASLGVPALLVDRNGTSAPDYEGPWLWCAPQIQRAKVVASLAARIAPSARHDRLVAAIGRTAAQLGLDMPTLQPRRFDAMSRAVDRLARRLASRMRSERVACVFVVSYYDVGGYAFVLAAARAGVPSVDIQHGVTGPLHMAYSGWCRHPAGGLSLLPRWFWSWTEADAALIKAWASRATVPHLAIAGGHPFLEAWRSGAMRADDATMRRLQRLLDGSKGAVRVLVTMQPGLASPQALTPLIEAMVQLPSVSWWVRLHPMAHGDRDEIEATLRRRGLSNWDVDDATALPLPLLLGSSDMHATHSSSAVIEAEMFGLYSIVWSSYGLELFDDAVSRGIAWPALDGESFRNAVDHLASRARIADAAPRNRTVHALRTILGLAA